MPWKHTVRGIFYIKKGVTDMADISEIIDSGSLRIRFQPIVSIKHMCIFGVEALCYARFRGTVLSADELFAEARNNSTVSLLDRACIQKAVLEFSQIERRDSLLLFLNFESSQIDDDSTDTTFILSQCLKAGIQPESVVIEIIESKVINDRKLQQFVSFYKKHGFSIAIDDLGQGYSNLSRLSYIAPAIVKTDKSLTDRLDHDPIKKSILSSLATLSRNIGALFLVEGAETTGAAVAAASSGAELLQGYSVSKPGTNIPLLSKQAGENLKTIMELTQQKTVRAMHKNLIIGQKHIDEMKRITVLLTAASPLLFEHIIVNWYSPSETCECAYVLDSSGFQITDVLPCRTDQRTLPSRLFRNPEKNSAHFLEPYYYIPFLSGTPYISERYISGATGRQCITITIPFPNKDTDYYFCADFSVPVIE
jgi:FOG: EAL domain